MPLARETLTQIIVANLFHSLACLFWIYGVKRIIKPFPADLYANLLQASLIFPAALAILRLFPLLLPLPLLPPRGVFIRVEEWAHALVNSGTLPKFIFYSLLAGVFIIFILQELIPLGSLFRRHFKLTEKPDPRLGEILRQVFELYVNKKLFHPYAKKLRLVYCVPYRIPLAALRGLISPVLVISDSLIKRLEEAELKGIMAHEIAHIYYGGNLQMLLLWGIRALQAFNPISLILFRELVETRELACDALAASVTSQPQVLAHSLLKFYESTSSLTKNTDEANIHSLMQARQEREGRAANDSTQQRLQALVSTERIEIPTPRTLQGVLLLILGGLLWTIA